MTSTHDFILSIDNPNGQNIYCYLDKANLIKEGCDENKIRRRLKFDGYHLKVLDKDKKGTTHRGYHWVYHAPLKRMVLFDYREGRGREGPHECLRHFKGHLQTDGYAVYEDFDRRSNVTLLHCMAHARRKFDEAKD